MHVDPRGSEASERGSVWILRGRKRKAPGSERTETRPLRRNVRTYPSCVSGADERSLVRSAEFENVRDVGSWDVGFADVVMWWDLDFGTPILFTLFWGNLTYYQWWAVL